MLCNWQLSLMQLTSARINCVCVFVCVCVAKALCVHTEALEAKLYYLDTHELEIFLSIGC